MIPMMAPSAMPRAIAPTHTTNDWLMLRGLRTASSGWLGKTIMAAVVGFLVISFGIWGIGDIFRNYTVSAVATVGSSKITVEQFRQLYQTKLEQISRQLRRPLPPEQARAFGLDRQVLGQWMQDAALDQVAQRMHLGISDAEVVRRITEDPSFKTPAGQFDPARFQAILQQIGYTEQSYLAEQRRETLRRQITSTLAGDLQAPKAATEAINRYTAEQRDADYVVLTRAQAGDIPPPAADVLAKYYDERKVLFRAPEYRKVTILALTPDEVAHTIEIGDADAKTYYDQNTNKYSVPEKRQIRQIVFPSQDEAHKAAERIAGGASFEDIAKERKLTDQDIDLGTIAKTALADPKVADAAFSLAAGQTSGAIDGAFGSVIVHVVKVEPGSIRPFEEVAGDIKKTLALERAGAEIRKLRDKVDDEMGGGARLEDIGKKLNLAYRTIDAIDRSGRGPDGKPVELVKGVDLLDGIFSADVGVENDALQTQDGGIVWYDLVAVTPSRERPLDEVKDQVEARWRDDEVVARLNAKAKEMVDKIKGGTSLADLAAAEKVKVESAKGIKRSDTKGPLPANAVAALFTTDKGAAGSADGKETTERIVFVVTDVTIPAFDPASADAKRIGDALRDAMANDLYSQFVAQAESQVGISVDQGALNQALGATSPQ
jgi:peptidyl-prolyl cis-trans isomerase D